MRRRDLSKSMFALAAGAGIAAMPRQAAAQACVPACYLQTSEEAAVSVTPLNTQWPPGHVDRYGSNTSPGNTDMSAAFNAAIRVAAQSRCVVRWGATAPYRLNNPINGTGVRGITFIDESSKNVATSNVSLVIGHNGHGFDLSNSCELVFQDVSIGTAAGVIAKTAFFAARNPAGSQAGAFRFYNLRTPTTCTFNHVFYGYGSEENNFINCFIYNAQGGSSLFNHNATNPSGYSSSFITIATGNQSNAGHRHIGGDYFNLGNSGLHNEVVFALENASNFTFRDGLWYCPNGLAYISVGGNSASNWITVDSVRGEPGGVTKPANAVKVVTTGTTGSYSHVFWTFNNVYADSSADFFHFADTAEIQNLTTTATMSQSGKLLSAYTIRHSFLQHMWNQITVRAGGSAANNLFLGVRQNVSILGASTNNSFDDTNTGVFGGNGYRFPETSQPSADPTTLDDYREGTFTPAVILGSGSVSHAVQTGSFTKVGRLVTIQLYVQLSAASGVGGSLRIGGLPYASSLGFKGAASVFVNSVGPGVTGPVYASLDAGQNSLSLFKFASGILANMGGDVSSSSNFAVTATYEI